MIQRYLTPVSARKSLVAELIEDKHFGFEIDRQFLYRLFDSLGPAGKAAVRADRERIAELGKRRARSAGTAKI